LQHTAQASEVATPDGSVIGEARMNRDFDDSLETGFQIATFQGPLCAEPVQGMAYFVESIQLSGDKADNDTSEWN